jgi:cell division protein FtsB
VVLGGVVTILTVLLAPALRSYVAQRQQIGALEQRITEQRRDVARLQQEQASWRDPAYVKAQARERLKFVMPGDRAYTVLDPQSKSRQTSPVARAADTASEGRSWFGDVWRSAQVAGGTAPP